MPRVGLPRKIQPALTLLVLAVLRADNDKGQVLWFPPR